MVVVPEFQFQLLIALISDTLMLISSARVVSVFNMIELESTVEDHVLVVVLYCIGTGTSRVTNRVDG